MLWAVFLLIEGLKSLPLKMKTTHTRHASVKTASELKLEKVNIRLDEVTRCEKFVKKERNALKLVRPKEEVKDKSDSTVTYCTQVLLRATL